MTDVVTKHKPNRERTFAMLCHLLGLCSYVGIPFGHILGPLVMWLLKKDEFVLVDKEGKEALNFQISMSIYFIVSGVLCFILIGFLFLAIAVVVHIALTIIASIKINNGESYIYPLTIRFLK